MKASASTTDPVPIPVTGGESASDRPLVMVQNLTKRYGDFFALSDCSLNVRQGSVFGLLGPNGAGKTTLIRSLLGFLKPSAGSASVCGYDPQVDGVTLRKQVAYLPGDARLPRHMRGVGVLRFFAEMHPSGDFERSREIADRLELNQRRHVAFMSTGMRQKLALSVVLSLSTPLLILDEPTANLDPTIRAIVLDLVLEARKAGRTVIFSSHVLSEIEQTCDRVAFLRHGKLALELNMSDLQQRHRVWGMSPQDTLEPPTGIAVNVASIDHDGSSVTGSDEVVASAGTGSSCNAKHSILIARDKEPSATVGDEPSLYGYRIDLAGDLSHWLPWLQQQALQRMRIEPLGLRAVYDSVHFGEALSFGEAK